MIKLLTKLQYILIILVMFNTHAQTKGPFFNVLDYGASSNDSIRATKGINAAIQAAKAAGGGTVYIPAGNYTCGPIELVSNLVLYFDAGAIVEFPAQRLPFT